MKNDIAVVTSNNNSIYQFKGEENGKNKFENLTKGGTGLLSDEEAKRMFTIPVRLNVIVNENPLVLELIKRLNLSYQK